MPPIGVRSENGNSQTSKSAIMAGLFKRPGQLHGWLSLQMIETCPADVGKNLTKERIVE